jgi:hypothetical protein
MTLEVAVSDLTQWSEQALMKGSANLKLHQGVTVFPYNSTWPSENKTQKGYQEKFTWTFSQTTEAE